MISPDQLVRDPIGAYPLATVAAFDPTTGDLPRRRLDQARLAEYLRRLRTAGAEAVLIGASTGQGHLRTVDELAEWFAAAAHARVAGLMLTALLRPEDGDETNRRFAGQLAQRGYSVAYVRPGTNLSQSASDDDVAANMRPVVAAIAEAGLAVGLYSIPDVSGVPMSCEVAAKLLQSRGGERIVAIKITEADYDSSTAKFLRDDRLARLKIVQGWDPHLARALREGGSRVGVTSGPMSFAVHQYSHLLKAAAAGDWNEVAAAQEAVSTLFRSMQDNPLKFADLQRAKYIMGLGHPITRDISTQQADAVLAALDSLPRRDDRVRLAQSLDLTQDGPFHQRLVWCQS